MTKRIDGDDGAFPIRGSKRKQNSEQQPIVGEANPNSRAAQWLREAAKKPPIKKPEEPIEQPNSTEQEESATVGQILDLVFDEIFEYMGRLENTMLEIYRDVQAVKNKVGEFEKNEMDFSQLEREFRSLQSIVLSLQNARQFDLSQHIFRGVSDPNVVTPTITTDPNPNAVTPTITTDQMDKG